MKLPDYKNSLLAYKQTKLWKAQKDVVTERYEAGINEPDLGR